MPELLWSPDSPHHVADRVSFAVPVRFTSTWILAIRTQNTALGWRSLKVSTESPCNRGRQGAERLAMKVLIVPFMPGSAV